jgi:beta-glucanase (GH16 family)
MPGSPQHRSLPSRRTAAIWIAALAALAMAGPISVNGAANAGPKTPPAPTGTAPDCGATITKSTGGAWTCTFADNFSGTSLDSTKWVPFTTKSSGVITTECRVSSNKNIAVSGGVLRLTVRKESKPVSCAHPGGSYTTRYTGGNVTSQGKFAQAYGRFEVRAAFPAATVKGLHSAIWLWPRYFAYAEHSGEIDIAEYRTGHSGYVVPYVHYTSTYPDPNRTNNWCAVSRPELFHSYVLEWNTQTLTFSFDGKVCLVNNWQPASPMIKPQPFDRPFFLNLTNSLGINANAFDAALTPLPSTMQVDYVRVWE